MAYLQIATQDGLQRVPLDHDHLRIGRLSSNDIILPYQQISREHAEIQQSAGSWWITDLDSTNGLQINGRRIDRHPLQPGERVQLAPGIMVWLMSDEDDLTALATTQMHTPDQSDRGAQQSGPRGAKHSNPAAPLRLQLNLPIRREPPGGQAVAIPADHAGPWAPPPLATTWHGDGARFSEPGEPRRFSERPESPAMDSTQADSPTSDLFRRRRSRSSDPLPLAAHGPPLWIFQG
ncbi:MAG TPA: FHA domain-containing protein, partial [Ktedonobacterales bacterium]|nr:FHA domain-containing protein [Ktedonobacterales bacterium]